MGMVDFCFLEGVEVDCFDGRLTGSTGVTGFAFGVVDFDGAFEDGFTAFALETIVFLAGFEAGLA
jgi:hypothetical protein